MASFTYRALDAAGLEQVGTLEAESARQARSILRERELFPIEIETSAGNSDPANAARISISELCLITRQFGALLSSGLTVEQALSALADQADKASSRQIISGVRSEVLTWPAKLNA